MDYETTILPKGTILFRGFDSTSTLTSDFTQLAYTEGLLGASRPLRRTTLRRRRLLKSR